MKEFLIWIRSELGRAVGFVLILAGVVAMLIGYSGLSEASRLSAQLSYLVSGGLMGLLLAGLGAAFMLSADIHDEWRKLDQLREAILATGGAGAGHAAGGDGPARELVVGAQEDEADATPDRRPKLLVGDGGSSRISLVLSAAGVLGAALLAVTWRQTATSAAQADGVAAALRGALVVMTVLVVAAFVVRVQRSVVTARTAALTAPLRARFAGAASHASEPDTIPVHPPAGEFYVTAAGLARYHRPGCPVVRDRSTTTLKPTAGPSSLTACEVCTVS